MEQTNSFSVKRIDKPHDRHTRYSLDNGHYHNNNGRSDRKEEDGEHRKDSSARQKCVEAGHGANVSRDRLCVYSPLSFGVSHIYIERQWLWKRREEARGEREKERETLLVVGLLPNRNKTVVILHRIIAFGHYGIRIR
jgi:hypothetical protein